MLPSSASSADLALKRIERSPMFQGAVIFIIVLSAITIGAKTYDLPALVANVLSVLDVGITIFFLIELLLRFTACNDRKRFLLDGWNLFDTIVVLGSLIPMQYAEAVLIGRLLRVFRVLRLVSVIPELRSLINSLLRAIPPMSYIALLMFIIFYIYGAIGSLMFAPINEALWGDITISMLTLFRIVTFEDWTDVMYETMAVHPWSWVYYISFIFLTAFVFLNMMVGAILEVMTAEHRAQSNDEASRERHDLATQIEHMQRQLDKMHSLLKERI
jgi:voltage-gated sodium channel